MADISNIFGGGSYNRKSPVENEDFVILVHIKNFGMIESADIDISKFTVFVGENNSGKTYLMQLIYGLVKSLVGISEVKRYAGSFPQTVNASNFDMVLDTVNAWIAEHKDDIVRSTFGAKIPLETLTLDIKGSIPEYAIEEHLVEYAGASGEQVMYFSPHAVDFFVNGVPERQIAVCDTSNEYRVAAMLQGIMTHIFSGFQAGSNPAVFFPASRSGLLSLHRLVPMGSDELLVSGKITAPTYDFMRFIQNYQYDPSKGDVDILNFINSRLVGGEICITNDGVMYKADDSEQWVPMGLASSIVNELAPLMFLLTGTAQHRYVLYDGIEIGLHPLKQQEFARLLVRMANSGFRMLVSTHSDTMALAITILVLLSSAKDREIKASKLGYTSQDFFKTSQIHVYQFSNLNGVTRIEELQCWGNLGIGYDFKLFNDANDKLYNDAVAVAGSEGSKCV